MKKLNCWELKGCGREPGVIRNTHELGECPAATETRLDGTYDGTNGGRCCWLVAGTLCQGRVQGMYAKKIGTCHACEFPKRVFKEECGQLVPTAAIL